MSAFFQLVLTHEEKFNVLWDIKVNFNKPDENDCVIWKLKSKTKNGYAIRSFVLRGHRYNNIRVHRLVYFLITSDDKLRYKNVHVSHKCHHKLCMNIDHMSLERARINNGRQNCKYSGGCSGHTRYGNCIIE